MKKRIDMLIYISGPMRGIKDFNSIEFEKAAKLLRSLGHEVISPIERNTELGFSNASPDGIIKPEHNFDLKATILWDLEQVAKCEGVYLLDGWSQSHGAQLEVSLAFYLSIPIAYEKDYLKESQFKI